MWLLIMEILKIDKSNASVTWKFACISSAFFGNLNLYLLSAFGYRLNSRNFHSHLVTDTK